MRMFKEQLRLWRNKRLLPAAERGSIWILARVQINGADGVKLRTELLENEEDEESRALELSELVAAHKRGLYIIVEDKRKELSLLGFDFSKHFDRYRVL